VRRRLTIPSLTKDEGKEIKEGQQKYDPTGRPYIVGSEEEKEEAPCYSAWKEANRRRRALGGGCASEAVQRMVLCSEKVAGDAHLKE